MAKLTLDQLPEILEQYGEEIRREVEDEAYFLLYLHQQ